MTEIGRSVYRNCKVCWRNVDGLLTETGRYIDGNWTIYWRKMDGLLTETDGLLKETVRSIDGNLTFYWRKLDVLLTETGRSIDENFMVNWRKECILLMETVQQIFFIFGTWKCDFCRVLKSTVSGTPSILLVIFCILEVRKCDCCRVVKPKVSRVRRFMLANFPHFGSLKERFLTIRESNVSRYLSKSGNFLFFWGLKMRLCRVVKSTFQGYQASCEQIFRMLVNWKCDFFRFVKPMFQSTLLRVAKFSSVWGPEIRFFPSRETHISLVPGLVLAYFLHFGGL